MSGFRWDRPNILGLLLLEIMQKPWHNLFKCLNFFEKDYIMVLTLFLQSQEACRTCIVSWVLTSIVTFLVLYHFWESFLSWDISCKWIEQTSRDWAVPRSAQADFKLTLLPIKRWFRGLTQWFEKMWVEMAEIWPKLPYYSWLAS